MRIKDLFESEEKHVAFCFGRLNPPTLGHKKLLDTVKDVGGDYRIFASQSQDRKKNPLPYDVKMDFLRKMFPDFAGNIVEDTNIRTALNAASYLYDQGYKHATFVAGSDRFEAMQKMLKTYNGVEGKEHGYYNFETLDFESSGEREDGAEGISGISASGARAAAAEGDIKAFAKATGAGEHTEDLYAAVRKGMGLGKDESEEESSSEESK